MYYVTLGSRALCAPGNAACTVQPGWGLTNTGPFSNMRSNAYWSGTTSARSANFAWFFSNYPGMQSFGGKSGPLYAVAVRPGNLSARSAPEPGSLAMLLAGLGALAAARALRGTGASGASIPWRST